MWRPRPGRSCSPDMFPDQPLVQFPAGIRIVLAATMLLLIATSPVRGNTYHMVCPLGRLVGSEQLGQDRAPPRRTTPTSLTAEPQASLSQVRSAITCFSVIRTARTAALEIPDVGRRASPHRWPSIWVTADPGPSLRMEEQTVAPHFTSAITPRPVGVYACAVRLGPSFGGQ